MPHSSSPDLNTHLRLQGAPDHLRHLIVEISRAIKYINYAIKTGDLGLAGSSNLYGEKQLALDVLSDTIITDILANSGLVGAVASEEKNELQKCKSEYSEYTVVFDPLDGSSLVDTNLAVGSIFGIYEKGSLIGKKGKEMVAALYSLYGPRTTLVYSIGKGVFEFTLNAVGEFHLSKENICIKEKATRFAPGDLKSALKSEGYHKALHHFMEEGHALRYSGGMVPDVNTIFMKGDGIFIYPGTEKKPEGKLRLVYECAPFAYLAEQAGGAATDGKQRILDIAITDLNQRIPIIIGSREEVEKIGKMLT